MNWFKVPKADKNKPKKGKKYSDWKPAIATEGKHQCVYCAIHESRFGGIRNFHVEHFKPKSLPRFVKLTNDWSNLYYSCSICNTFKSNDWKPNPNNNGTKVCYLDPSKVDYSSIIDVDWDTGKIQGKNIAIRYMIEKIYLNRPQLIYERRRRSLSNRLKELCSFRESIHNTITKTNDPELLQLYLEYVDLLCKSSTLERDIYEAIPYEDADTRRN